MKPIGASATWKWVPYTNAYVTSTANAWRRSRAARAGAAACGSAATTWPGSDCCGSGTASGATGRSSACVREDGDDAEPHGPDYGFLWWLNTKQAQWPGSPVDAFRARVRAATSFSFRPVMIWSWCGAGVRSRPRGSVASSPPSRTDPPNEPRLRLPRRARRRDPR